MYTVAQVLTPEFGRTWHEAVAIVQEIASAVGSVARVPGPDDLLLAEDGTLTLGFASEQADNPVASLGGLLVQLLYGIDAPTLLRELAAENAGPAPAHATVEEFARAVAFYERPDRASDLRAVAERLATWSKAPAAGSDDVDELERLRAKLQNAPAAPPAERPPLRLSRLQGGLAASLALTLTVVGAFAASQAAGVRTAARPEGIDRPAQGPVAQQAKLAEKEVVTPENKEVAAAPPPAVTKSLQAAVETKARKQVTAALQPLGRWPLRTEPGAKANRDQPGRGADDRISADDSSAAIGRSSPPLVLALPPVAGKGSRRAAATDAGARTTAIKIADSAPVYSAQEPDVEPARLTKSQLPKEPAPGPQTGYFDLVIDEAGNVEVVTLISPTHGYYDRMLVAAAKAWTFKPARLHGEPVKYRVRMPITLQDPR